VGKRSSYLRPGFHCERKNLFHSTMFIYTKRMTY
jgi:hypothetical protein